jgi:hypothetical protein
VFHDMNFFILTLPVGPEIEGPGYWNRGRKRPVRIGRNSWKTVVSGLSKVCKEDVRDDRPEEKRSYGHAGLRQRRFFTRPRLRLSSVKVSHEPPGRYSRSAEAGRADANAPCGVNVAGETRDSSENRDGLPSGPQMPRNTESAGAATST